MCDIMHCLYENYTNEKYSEFIQCGLSFMLKVFNVFKDEDDFEDILKDIYEKEFFDFLEKITEYSLSNDFKYLILILKIYNSVFSIDLDEPLIDLYNSFTGVFDTLFKLIIPTTNKEIAEQIITLLANITYADKAVAHDLIDKGYFYKLIEVLKSHNHNTSDIIYALDKMFKIASQDYSVKVFNHDSDFIHVLFTAVKDDISTEDCKVIFSIINFMLSINDDNKKLIDEITNNETYMYLVDEFSNKNKGNAIDTIESGL